MEDGEKRLANRGREATPVAEHRLKSPLLRPLRMPARNGADLRVERASSRGDRATGSPQSKQTRVAFLAESKWQSK